LLFYPLLGAWETESERREETRREETRREETRRDQRGGLSEGKRVLVVNRRAEQSQGVVLVLRRRRKRGREAREAREAKRSETIIESSRR